MYSRNYYPDESEIKVPENYDGIAFSDKALSNEEDDVHTSEKKSRLETKKDELKFSPKEIEDCEEVFKSESENKKGIFGIDFLSFFKGIIPGKSDFNLKSLIPKIEAEELLLLGLAAFLFLSKDGDKECALILLILVFIH